MKYKKQNRYKNGQAEQIGSGELKKVKYYNKSRYIKMIDELNNERNINLLYGFGTPRRMKIK